MPSIPKQLYDEIYQIMKTFYDIRFIGFLLSISVHLGGFSQLKNLKFEHLSVQDGLSDNSVLSIIQDKEGFMWFGTEAGLNKYDGYTFTVFNPDPKYPNSTLKDNYINDIHEDGKGRLWIGGYGLHQLDKRTGKVSAYLADTSKLIYLNVNCTVYEDKEGILWTSAGGGLNRFDPATKRFISYTSPKLVPNYGVVEDGTGKIWMGSDVGLYQFDRKTATFKSFPLASKSNPHLPIMAVLLDKEELLWVGTSQEGLFRIDTKRKLAYAEHYNPEGQINKIVNRNGIFEDRSGYIWIATTEGLQRVDKKANQVTTFRVNTHKPGSLSSNNVLSIYQDKIGTLWVGTDNGINKAPAYVKPFSARQITYSAQLVRHSENIVKTLLEDKAGIVWLGTVKGLYKFNSRNNLINYVPFASNHFDDHRFDVVNKSLSNEIWVIHEDYKGRLWVGTATGLYLLNRTTGKFTHFPCKIPIHSMDEDSFRKLWIPGGIQQSGNAVMAVFDLQNLAFSYTQYALNDLTGIKDMYLNGIMVSRTGDIWVATKAWGISRMNRETGKFTHYLPGTNLSDSTVDDRDVWCLYEDKKGIIWAGTNQGGLNRLDPTTGKFSHFTTHEGLPSNYVLSIAEDETGNLWLGTDKGLSCFNLKTKSFRNFNISDGLPDNEFMPGAVYRSKEKLLFGTSNGFIFFNPDSIKENNIIPPIYLTNLKVLEKNRVIPDSLLELPHNENFLAFEFVALNYDVPEKNKYAYRLVGLDKDWIYSANRRYASYPGLAPGKYTFSVKASNNDGIWNEKGTSLTIVIRPPWWKTWWAYLLWAVIILALLYSIYYIRISRLKELLQVRNKIAHDLHDDVGSTLSSISIMSEMAKRTVPGSSSVLLEKIGNDAQLMQESMSDIVWAINPKNDRFENILQRMKIFSSEMLEARNIELTFSADETLNDVKLSMNARKDLYFIFKEAVTNIAKYTVCKNATVKISLRDKTVDLLVEDDGHGFDPTHQTLGGNGLYNMQKRAKDLKGALKIDSQKDRGTTVHLQFKIT